MKSRINSMTWYERLGWHKDETEVYVGCFSLTLCVIVIATILLLIFQ